MLNLCFDLAQTITYVVLRLDCANDKRQKCDAEDELLFP